MNNRQYNYDKLFPEEQQIIADLIAEDTLKYVNMNCKEVYPPKTFYTMYGKRILDIAVSLAAIIVTIPFNLLIGIITVFDVGVPIFFVQERIGLKGKIFKIIKFRNMTNEVDSNGILLSAMERCTKWGIFVRKTSLDELLNFWNIFKGEMSIIGPRPLPKLYCGRFSVRHNSRHNVKPGLDCPLHSDKMKYMTWENRLENDIWYVENISLKTDVKLILLLFKEVFVGKERAARGYGGIDGTFMGYYMSGKVMNSNHIPVEYYERMYKVKEDRERILGSIRDTIDVYKLPDYIEIKQVYNRREKEKIIKTCDNSFTKSVVHLKNYKELIEKIDTYAVFIAVYLNNNAIGFSAFYANDHKDKVAFITLMAVNKIYQGYGIGKALMYETFRRAKSYSMEKIRLAVLKVDKNQIMFFKHVGYEFEKESETDETRIFMIRNL